MNLDINRLRISFDGNLSETQVDIAIQNLDIAIQQENAESKTALSGRLITSRRARFRLDFTFSFSGNVDNNIWLQAMNTCLSAQKSGNANIYIELGNGSAFDTATKTKVIMDSTSSYNVSYRNQFIQSSLPNITFKSVDTLAIIPTAFGVLNR